MKESEIGKGNRLSATKPVSSEGNVRGRGKTPNASTVNRIPIRASLPKTVTEIGEGNRLTATNSEMRRGVPVTSKGNGKGSGKKSIVSFRDLRVYESAYNACIIMMTEIIPKLPKVEQYDLTDQLRRSCKAIPRLIAEGYAKKHQKAGFQKYIDDAMAEANETVVGLCQCKDIYSRYVQSELCCELIDQYDKIGRQLYKLGEAWRNFRKR